MYTYAQTSLHITCAQLCSPCHVSLPLAKPQVQFLFSTPYLSPLLWPTLISVLVSRVSVQVSVYGIPSLHAAPLSLSLSVFRFTHGFDSSLGHNPRPAVSVPCVGLHSCTAYNSSLGHNPTRDVLQSVFRFTHGLQHEQLAGPQPTSGPVGCHIRETGPHPRTRIRTRTSINLLPPPVSHAP